METDSTNFEKTAEQWAAFQKIWAETFTRLMQAGFSASPEAAPPDFLRQVRTGIFQALSQSWDEFMRSPQFLESMKQYLEGAVSFRKWTTDFLTKAHHEMQEPTREDIDSIMLSVRQSERRILDRLEELAAEVQQFKERKPPSVQARAKMAARRPTSVQAKTKARKPRKARAK